MTKRLLVPILFVAAGVLSAAVIAGEIYRVKFVSSAAEFGVTCSARQYLTSAGAVGTPGGDVSDVTIYGGDMPATCTVSRVSADGLLTNEIVVVHALVPGAAVASNLAARASIASGDSILILAGDTNTPFKAQIVVNAP